MITVYVGRAYNVDTGLFATVAVDERSCVHGAFAFGLELVDDDKIAIGAL